MQIWRVTLLAWLTFAAAHELSIAKRPGHADTTLLSVGRSYLEILAVNSISTTKDGKYRRCTCTQVAAGSERP